uniref:Uncharacterized protein n=1 Tax=Anaerolinea thermolimosa TaxID=229919 RepID=A0A7C4PEG6_9CHLR
MGWQLTAAAGVAALALLILSGAMQARRGIGRLSLLPWDYLMIAAAVMLLAVLAHAAVLWRDGWPA